MKIVVNTSDLQGYISKFAHHSKYRSSYVYFIAKEDGIFVSVKDKIIAAGEVFDNVQLTSELTGTCDEEFTASCGVMGLYDLINTVDKDTLMSIDYDDNVGLQFSVEDNDTNTVLGNLDSSLSIERFHVEELPNVCEQYGFKYNADGYLMQYDMKASKIKVYAPLTVAGSVEQVECIIKAYSAKYVPKAEKGENFMTTTGSARRGRGKANVEVQEEIKEEVKIIAPEVTPEAKPEVVITPVEVKPEVVVNAPEVIPAEEGITQPIEDKPRKRRSSVEVEEAARNKAIEYLVGQGYTVTKNGEVAEETPKTIFEVSGEVTKSIKDLQALVSQYSSMVHTLNTQHIKLLEENTKHKDYLEKLKQVKEMMSILPV
jgi:hypothetical protein